MEFLEDCFLQGKFLESNLAENFTIDVARVLESMLKELTEKKNTFVKHQSQMQGGMSRFA
jgi:hypothetical protein